MQARARINSLRTEALSRNSKFGSQVESLRAIKDSMVEYLEKSNAALAGRNEAAEALKRARAEEAEEKSTWEGRLRGLQEAIAAAQTARLEDVKARATIKHGEEQEEDAAEGGPGSGNLTEEQEAAARESIITLDRAIVEHETIIADLHRLTLQLQEVFRAMIQQAGLESLDQLVERFAAAEAHKYEMYGYVQHINGETASYVEMCRDTQKAQADYVQQLAQSARAQRERLDGMMAELNSLQAQAETVEEQRAAIHSVASQVVLQLLRVYAACGGDDTGRLSLLPHEPSAVRRVSHAHMAGQQRVDTEGQRAGRGTLTASDGPSLPSGDAAQSTLASQGESKASVSDVQSSALDAAEDFSLAVGREEIVSVLGFIEQVSV